MKIEQIKLGLEDAEEILREGRPIGTHIAGGGAGVGNSKTDRAIEAVEQCQKLIQKMEA